MASEPDQDLVAQAVAWHLRLKDGTGAEWRAFVEWLEADPARSEAYDRVEAADAMIAGTFGSAVALEAPVIADDAAVARGAPAFANDDDPDGGVSHRRWLMGLAAGIAAAVSLVVATSFLISRPDHYEVASAPGEQRRVDIGDGSYALLNGDTRLVLDRNDTRSVELVNGEATFTVGHDSDRPFTVMSGRHHVQDLGTTFNVTRDRDDFSVEVIEGTVVYDPDAAAVPLSAGQGLRASGSGSPVVFRIDPQAIAGWRGGQLTYVNAPMSRVATDLSRTLGVTISSEASVAGQPFTGVVRIEEDVATTISGLALAADVHARRVPDGWVFEPVTRASR
ncbi:MAG TPA: FecR domain-containing protein [Croceibacterium sp.]